MARPDAGRPGRPARRRAPRARPSSASTSSRSTGSAPRSTRFGERFSSRVLTDGERRYVRDRPETFAGRWAAKEAVSKVLGLGVRGIGWRDIEVERLPTGQPSVRLHGRAAQRAEQLGMGRIAVSISHESEYAVAIAFGVRTAGGRYVFPLDIDDTARRPRAEAPRALRADARPPRGDHARSRPAVEVDEEEAGPMADRRPVGFGRRGGGRRRRRRAAGRRCPTGAARARRRRDGAARARARRSAATRARSASCS